MALGPAAAALAGALASNAARARPVEVPQAPGAGSQDAALIALALALLLALIVAAWALLRQRRAEAQARELGAQLQALTGLLDVWQWRTDREHRLVLLQPPSGTPADAWPAPPAATLLWERFQVDDARALRARMDSGAALGELEVREPREEGSERRAILRGASLCDGSGRFAGYIGTLRELESRRETELAATLQTPALEMPTFAEPESFGYTVSHDLRAPLRVVEGFTKIVKEDYGRVLDRVGHDHLDRVLAAATRMNSMIDALLALSKLSSQPLARQPVSLSQLAGFVVDDLRRQSPGRHIDVRIAPDMLVRGDPTLLRILLENLLGNAWKYTAHRERASIDFAPKPGSVDTYTVRDNGAGFDMRFADRLFGPFQRLHSASEFPGHGVGLASVRRIVHRHGGEIWAEAEVGVGARFHFSLPQREHTH